jgi:hypothetical protein
LERYSDSIAAASPCCTANRCGSPICLPIFSSKECSDERSYAAVGK